MNQNYLNNYNYQPIPNYQNKQIPTNPNDERFIGGLAFPFLLGGVTGAALAPAFWRPSPYATPYYYQPYPYYNYPYYR